MARQDEVRAAARLGGEALSGVVGVVGEIHQAVSTRLETPLPPAAAPVMATNRALVGALYAAVDAGQRAATWLGAEAVNRRSEPDAPPPSKTDFGRKVLPMINGIWGDRVAARHPELSIPMAVRVDDEDVPMRRDAVAEAFPDATGRLVVFVHGLVEHDRSWQQPFDARPGSTGASYGDALRDELGHTPVYLRYNSGLRVSDNGQQLSRLLGELVDAWPVPVRGVSLVGHSMGGLVARSAIHYGDRHGAAWVPWVRVVACLGTPHLGAPLEQGVHVAEWAMRKLPETQPLGRILAGRSVGVKDLRYGAIVDEDWSDVEPEEFLQDRCTDVPFLPHATYCFVSASIHRDPGHLAGRLIGDGMVRYPSAAAVGRTGRQTFQMDDSAHVGGIGHLELLRHHEVYELLRDWLSAPRPTAVVVRPTSTTSLVPHGIRHGGRWLGPAALKH